MRIRPRSFVLLLVLALSACSLIPPYSRPTVDVPVGYKEEGPWRPAAGKLEAPEKWWQAFDDPLLNALEEQVLIDNQNIKLAEAQYRAARAAVDSARASLFPSLDLNASATRSRSSAVTGSGSADSTARITNLYSLSGQASWEIDLWGPIRSGVVSAEAQAESSAGALEAARLSAQALLAQSYFQMRAADAEVALLNRSIEIYARYLELTRNRVAAGVASPLDVSLAETQLNSARSQLAEAQLQRAQAEHAVAALIGKPPAALTIPPAGPLAEVPAAPALIPSAILETRYDIYSAERQVAAANAQIGVARAAYFPTIDLLGSGGYRSTALSDLFSAPARFWSLGPTLALTLFDGGARAAAVEQARAGYDQTVASYRQTVLTAFQEVEDNLAAAHLLADEAQSQAAAVAAAARAREISENQYRAGTVASLAVIVAQAAELNAENAAISIWNRRMAAAVQLYKNEGGRLPSPAAQAAAVE
jgi:NodT family efflux transporter outer membrane factor (OMF) lipoprotein